jgi:hypothetical protein
MTGTPESDEVLSPNPLFIGLFSAGLIGLAAIPLAINTATTAKKEPPKTLDAVQVIAPGNNAPARPAGWLQIDYQEKMRDNEDALFKVTYVAQGALDARAHQAFNVSVDSPSLTLLPEPLTYSFNGARLANNANDSHYWTVSAKKEGDFVILVRFAIPSGLFIGQLAVNGNRNGLTAEIPLKVNVYTPYLFGQISAEVAKYAGAILSFLLTLPYLSDLVKWYRRRKKKRPQHGKTESA